MAVLPAHHAQDGYRNDPPVADGPSTGVFFYVRRVWHSIFRHDVPDGHALVESEAIRLREAVSGDRVTWLGHSTFLMTLSGRTILTDPFLTDHASPVSWAGPRRMAPPGIAIENLPPIDILVVSHDHFDHLDLETVRALPQKESITVLVPLGLKSFFKGLGYANVVALDWHMAHRVHGITMTALPAIHNSGRGIGNRNQTLWASWAIAGPTSAIYFAGDTAYSETIFKTIGSLHGPFDIAIVPIGAYEPREIMVTHHMNPEDAVSAGMDVGATALVASHWGTINLSDEPPWEPPKRFAQAAEDRGMAKEDAWVMRIGETRPISR